MTLYASVSHYQVAFNLALLGGFCVFGFVSMWMRTMMAKGSGAPIEDDPEAPIMVRAARGIAKGERRRVPLYRWMSYGFLAIGVALLVSAAVAALVTWL